MPSATERLLRRMWGDEKWGDAIIQTPDRVPTPRNPDAMKWSPYWYRVKDLPGGLDKWLADNAGRDIYITPALHTGIHRRKEDVIACGAWVFDDVGTRPDAKINPVELERVLGPPSLAVETSPQNEQWWYFDPETHGLADHTTGLRLVQSTVGFEVLDGQCGTHAFRTPAGTNLKRKKYGPNGHPVRAVRGTPGVTLTFDELRAKCSQAGLSSVFDATPEGGTAKRSGLKAGHTPRDGSSGPKDPCASMADPDPILKLLDEHGLVTGDRGDGKVDIICPNIEEHTGGDASGTIYVGNNRFWCTHAHCRFGSLVHGRDKQGVLEYEPDGRPKMVWQPDYAKTFDLMRKRLAERVADESGGLLGRTPNALGLGKEFFPDGSELSDSQIEQEAEKMDTDKRFWRGVLSEWVYVVEHDGFVNISTGYGPVSEKQFNAMMRDGCEFGHRGLKAANARFLNDRRARVVAGVDYLPGADRFVTREDGREAVNLWSPSPLVAWPGVVTDADVAPWLAVLAHWLPDPVADAQGRGMVLDFLAHVVQFPGQKINWLLLIHSETQGVGKDMFFSVMDKVLGEANVTQVTSEQLVGGYKAGWVKRQLVFAQELCAQGPRGTVKLDGYNAMKPFLSNPPKTVRVDDKNVRSHVVSNVACFIAFTNKGNAIPMEATDRRFVVIESEQDKRLPPALAKPYADWLEDPGSHAHAKIRAWLEQRVIGASGSGFTAHTCPVLIGDKGKLAAAKQGMASAALGPGGRWVQDLLDGRKLVSTKEFVLLLSGGMRAGQGGGLIKELIPNAARNTTGNEIAAALELAGGVRLRSVQIRMGGPMGRVRVWVLDGRAGLYGQMTADQLRDAYLKELQSVGLGWVAGSTTGASAGSGSASDAF
jgi:hypothetical protein